MKKKVLFVFAVICCLLLNGCGAVRPPEETTIAPVEYNTDINGELIPAFSDVSQSVLDPSLFFKNEDGRMFYADPSVSTYTGIDVSVFQGDIDWAAVKADGIDFVMLRAGYRGYGSKGIMGEDESFRKNAAAAKAAGLDVGAYFFSQATNAAEAQEEARFVLEIIKDADITYPVAYDWEIIDYDTARTDGMSSAQITECARAFCDTVSAAGYEAVIYFNCEVGYFNYDLSGLNNIHFWLAEYGDTPSFYYDYKIWQYTMEGSVDGISGNVDMNICVRDFSGSKTVG